MLRLLSVVSVVAAIARAEALRLRWVIAVIERKRDMSCQPGSSGGSAEGFFLILSRHITAFDSLFEFISTCSLFPLVTMATQPNGNSEGIKKTGNFLSQTTVLTVGYVAVSVVLAVMMARIILGFLRPKRVAS